MKKIHFITLFFGVLLLLALCFMWSHEVYAPHSGNPLMSHSQLSTLLPEDYSSQFVLNQQEQEQMQKLIGTAQTAYQNKNTEKQRMAEKSAMALIEVSKNRQQKEKSLPAPLTLPRDQVVVTKMLNKGIPKPSQMGSFTVIDAFHYARGMVFVFPDTSQGPLLRLSPFETAFGPDLRVYLSKNTDIKSSKDLGEYTELGALKGIRGDQNYVLPENYKEYSSVVIWCKAFEILFSSAQLKSL